MERGENIAAPKESFILATVWVLVPLTTLFMFSVFLRGNLFLPRYYVAAAPGLALLFGWWIRAAVTAFARAFAASALIVWGTLSFGQQQHGNENWAGAMAKVRELTAAGDTPVLMASGFLEATDAEALYLPNLRVVLFAPLALYPAGARVIPLPRRLDEKSMLYLETIVAADLLYRTRFVLVCEWDERITYDLWLRGRLAPQAFRSVSQGNFGDIGVLLFCREPRAAH